MPKDLDYNRLLIKVAHLYYERDMIQSQIAKKVGLSRQKVQRLLKEAKEKGIVRIGISPITGIYSNLEQQLEEKYNLREVVIIETSDYENLSVVSREIGAGAAEYLLRVIRSKDKIVISWGTALLGMVNSLFHQSKKEVEGIKVIQGLGGLVEPNHETHAVELTRRLALELNGQAILLPAPGAAGSKSVCHAFYADPHVQETLGLAKSANLAFVSIGYPRKESILVKNGNIVAWSEVSALKEKGAIGDINLRYFDKKGKLVKSDLDKRVVGLTLKELKATGHVVGVAGGKVKLNAIQGALAGNHIDVLITDHITAQKLLRNTKSDSISIKL